MQHSKELFMKRSTCYLLVRETILIMVDYLSIMGKCLHLGT